MITSSDFLIGFRLHCFMVVCTAFGSHLELSWGILLVFFTYPWKFPGGDFTLGSSDAQNTLLPPGQQSFRQSQNGLCRSYYFEMLVAVMASNTSENHVIISICTVAREITFERPQESVVICLPPSFCVLSQTSG